jgi:hypothetical protein
MIAAKIRQTLPAGILVMVLNIGGWWVSGGLAPSEAWTGLLRVIADYWPRHLFLSGVHQRFASGRRKRRPLVMRNLIITGAFAAAMLAMAYVVFGKEAREG